MQDLLIVNAAQNALDKNERPAKDHAVDLEDGERFLYHESRRLTHFFLVRFGHLVVLFIQKCVTKRKRDSQNS